MLVSFLDSYKNTTKMKKPMEEETIWQQLYRFIGSIQDEIKDDKPDLLEIDFWLFKIERRVKILEKEMTNREKA